MYLFLKNWISLALFCYYRKIEVVGLENIPKNKPVLFLSNHQNALLDILLIATRCNHKPWYLTRADVFRGKWFRRLFSFLQMLPIYRIRDGKANLYKNKKIFETCAQLLNSNEAILLFPEADHNLRRRVRPLSKGFTRIIDASLELDANIDLQLVPVGQNYQLPKVAGDQAAIYFGKPISIQDFKHKNNFVGAVKDAVFNALTQLTTHVQPDEDYDMLMKQLLRSKVDFTKPEEVNSLLAKGLSELDRQYQNTNLLVFRRLLFRLHNLPLLVLWRLWLKPKVPEPEFEGTFRLGFALLAYPTFYAIAVIVLSIGYNMTTACFVVLGHAALNLLLVKWGITSYPQRK